MRKLLKRFAFLLLFVSLAFGSTAGPTIVGTGADGGGGLCAWTNPGNITANDGVFATSVCGGATQNTNFINATMGASAFSVPAGSTILGIQADISRKTDAGTDVLDLTIKALKAGVSVGTNQSASAFWPTVQTTATFGGAANLWGTTWTATDVNASNFGAQFQANITTIGNTAYVDWVAITVTYNPPAGGGMGRRVIRTQTRKATINRAA